MKILHLIALAATAILICGCEDDKDPPSWQNLAPSSSSKSVSGSIVGTWELSDGGTPWYAHFASDGTWKITDDKGGSKLRVYGSYSTSGNSFKGSMLNPGVGDGEINGTISGKTMSMDFVEHWHTPYKHVAFTGPKL